MLKFTDITLRRVTIHLSFLNFRTFRLATPTRPWWPVPRPAGAATPTGPSGPRARPSAGRVSGRGGEIASAVIAQAATKSTSLARSRSAQTLWTLPSGRRGSKRSHPAAKPEKPGSGEPPALI